MKRFGMLLLAVVAAMSLTAAEKLPVVRITIGKTLDNKKKKNRASSNKKNKKNKKIS